MSSDLRQLNDLTGAVIASALRVHSTLGPGLLESAYHACLIYELGVRRLDVQSQVAVPIDYNGVIIETAYKMDLLVENQVVVELKTVSKILPVHEAQLLSYLRLGRRRVGLLINFHELHLRDGIKRMVN
ncbi:MAG TPA: GxxExxY protein [Gemmatimonadaceae bacterium]|jgi:GxxExxY protein|nr:GxxExxY protein [Gemmatimonadaceae bacterium]